MAVSVATLVTVGTAFYALGLTKVYRSTTTILIDPNPPKPLGQEVQGVVDMGTGLYWNNHEYYQTQYRIIRSETIADATVSQLGLQNDPRFVLNLPSGSPLPPEATFTPKQASAALLGRLTVEPIKESRLVSVSFDDADPERARRIVVALVALYIDQNVDRVLDSTRSAAEWLEVQLERLKGELTDNELALHQYKKDKDILSISMDDQSNMLREEMQLVNAELTRSRMERMALKARQEQIASVDPSNPSELPAQELLDSKVLSAFRADYVSARQEVEALLGAGRGANHPSVKAAEARAQTLEQSLVKEITNVKAALERSLSAKQKEVEGLSGLLSRAKKQALELNRLELEYRRLERSKTNTEKLYSLVLERSKESNLTQIMRFNNISVIDPASTPTAPVKPRMPLFLLSGVLGGLALGIGAALLRGSVDRSFKDPEDLEAQLGLNFLGLLPRASQGARRSRRSRRDPALAPELSAHEDSQGTVAEAARAIRTNLTFLAPDSAKRRILVTSGGPSEGKTTVACSIAIALAQTNLSVLLVDCDLRRPRLHRIFGRPNDRGVSTAIVEPDSIELDQLATEIPNLSLLCAGPHTPNPAELLESKRCRQLMTRLEQRFDRIVFDSPPVAAVADAAILSTQVDGTVFVVRGGSTRRDLARRTVRTLRDVGCNLLGVVLNATDLRNGRYSDYYYYRYYGAERQEGSEGSKRRSSAKSQPSV